MFFMDMLRVARILNVGALAGLVLGCGATKLPGDVGESADSPVSAEQQAAGPGAAPVVSSVAQPGPPAPPARLSPAVQARVLGHWYLDREGDRRVLTLEAGPDGKLSGRTRLETAGAADDAAEAISLDEAAGTLSFRVREGNDALWYQMKLVEGIVRGRFANLADPRAPSPTDPTAFTGRVIGWRSETFDAQLTPRTFELSIDGRVAMLRIDRARPSDPFVGRLNIYTDANGGLDEQPSEDVEIQSWNGRQLAFTRVASLDKAHFTGAVDGRTIAGTFTTDSGAGGPWKGTRAEVLSHGLVQRPATQTRSWQSRTRERLRALLMGGAPAPLSITATPVFEGAAPYKQTELLANRDDASEKWPQAYTVSELRFEVTLPNPYGGQPLIRAMHAFMSVPTTAVPAGGYPVVVAVNGHWGSARQVFDPQNPYYWYGEAFARRSNVVLALDMGHRPWDERANVYGDIGEGDDPTNGNGPHPSIHAAGMTSDWEEDGERTWDVMRGLDYVLRRTDVNPARVTIAGLSMGGEVTDWVGAMDDRFAVTIAAGAPPDYTQMTVHGNHACWSWQAGNAREFVDPSDLHALVAGRTVIRETGRQDLCYSSATEPFSTAKQVIRRAQPAFDALGGKLIHYLHFDGHIFHFGDQMGDAPALGLTTPAVIGPTLDQPWSMLWQHDDATTVMAASVFDELP
jgi:dienelactone hydrolase